MGDTLIRLWALLLNALDPDRVWAIEADAKVHRRLARALAERVVAQSELLSKRAERPVSRPWWERANEVEGGCPL